MGSQSGRYKENKSYLDDAAANHATMCQLALNLLKQDQTKKRGFKGKHFNASRDHTYLLRLLASIALPMLLLFTGCIAIGNCDAQRPNATPGQQLIDLQKAQMISPK